jgi:hypothetical protein
MAKLTINDTDYYTDDFNEDQMKMYQEVQIASSEIERMSYLVNVLKARQEMLAGMIVQAAESEVEDAQDEPEA